MDSAEVCGSPSGACYGVIPIIRAGLILFPEDRTGALEYLWSATQSWQQYW